MTKQLPGKSIHHILWAVSLFVVWTGVTYLLEGRISTFLRPEAVLDRIIYILTANIAIGIVGSIAVIAYLTKNNTAIITQFGFRNAKHTLWSVIVGGGLGFILFIIQSPPSLDPIVLINIYSQTLVVSVAEILVCWVVLARIIHTVPKKAFNNWSYLIAILISAVAFGLYHYAHSPPFNTFPMVLFLTGIGLLTGTFYFFVNEIYGAIIFHNFFALFGIIEALEEAGNLTQYTDIRYPLILTASVSLLGLILAEQIILHKSFNYEAK